MTDDNPTFDEKIEILSEYFEMLNNSFEEREVGELMLVLKALLCHIGHRTETNVVKLLEALRESYIERVVPILEGELDEDEIRQLLIDELARQEEFHDA